PGQIELVDGGPRPQSLQHRVAALDDPVGFRCGLPPMVPSLPHISCRLSVLLCSSIPYFPAEQKKYFSTVPAEEGHPPPALPDQTAAPPRQAAQGAAFLVCHWYGLGVVRKLAMCPAVRDFGPLASNFFAGILADFKEKLRRPGDKRPAGWAC